MVFCSYESRLRETFGENLFGVLTTWLIKPRPHIAGFVDKFVAHNFQAVATGFSAANGDQVPYHVVGVHMRSGMGENSQDVRVSLSHCITGLVWPDNC